MDGLDVKEDLTITEWPIRILDALTRVTRNRVIMMCKVQWSNHAEDEATWEREEELKEEYPHLFWSIQISRTRFILRGVGFVTP
jgi:hypothetical protein